VINLASKRLKKYRKKRDFSRTNEPFGDESSSDGNLFVIHKHDATRLHYDLRLQIGELLKSWAVPKGPSLDPKEKRLAVEVESHPLEYVDFEAVIPDGQYGAGPMIIWDRGSWAPMGDPIKELEKGSLKFRLSGEKLKGGWALVRLKHEGEENKNWLLIKEIDQAANSDFDILEANPNSVKSGLSTDELKASRTKKRRKTHSKFVLSKIAGATKAEFPRSIGLILPSPEESPPPGDDWLHEIKFDGYRTIARIQNGETRLLTRNGQDWTERYGSLREAFQDIPCKSAILDGEIVVLDNRGVSHFGDLQEALSDAEYWRLNFFAFDILYLNGYDLKKVRLNERKKTLSSLLDPVVHETSPIQISDFASGQGQKFFNETARLGLEGVVSKRSSSTYEPGRNKQWIKSKSFKVDDFAIAGYQTSKAAGGISALLLAQKRNSGWVYVGKVGSGFTEATQKDLQTRLMALLIPKPAIKFSMRIPNAQWVKPYLFAEVQFSEYTKSGYLRHPVFRGLRLDKSHCSNDQKKLITDQHLAAIWVTNPQREMFGPDATKLDIAIYYAKIGDYLLPHLFSRPLTLVRCPTGNKKDCFFQRHAFVGMPDDVKSFAIGKNENRKDYIYINNAPGYLSLAQFGVVEFHPWGCRVDKILRPDRLVIDLDPGEDLDWRDIVNSGKIVRDEMEGLGLCTFVKTSGSRGIHIVVPTKRLYSWSEIHDTAKKLALYLAKRAPRQFTASVAKRHRVGRIFIDYNRNARGATTVAPYSLRALEGLPVSTPLTWDQIDSLDDPRDLNYATVADFLTSNGDSWSEIDKSACTLSREFRRKLIE